MFGVMNKFHFDSEVYESCTWEVKAFLEENLS